MKNFIIILLLFIVVLLYFSQKWSIEEGFTPTLRRIYRPYIRRAHVTTESFYADKSTGVSNLFRRFGIM